MESNFEWITANGDIGIRFFHSIERRRLQQPAALAQRSGDHLSSGRPSESRFGERRRAADRGDELLVINSGTIHAVTAYPNQAIVLQVPYEMLLQYMEHYDQLYFVVDERPGQ